MQSGKNTLRHIFLMVAAFALLLASFPLSALTASAATSNYVFYDEALRWNNWSWGTSVNPSATSPVYAGTKSLAVTYQQAWAALSLQGSVSTSGYSNLQFAIRSSAGGLPNIRASVYNQSGTLIKQVAAESYATQNSSGWYTVSIPLSTLGAADITISRVQLQDGAGSAQSTFYVDNLVLSGSGSATATPTPTATATSTSTAPSGGTYPTGSFKPTQCPTYIDNAIRSAVAKYNLPRWFYYAIIQRESSFDPNAVSVGNDLGLTQLGGIKYHGELYPENLNIPYDDHQQYGYDMNFRKFGKWILMHQVTRLDDPFNPTQNLDRFSSGYAVPAFYLFKRHYGLSDTETLRAVAFHWNKGVYMTYDRNNTDYLGLYDKFVGQFKPTVDSQDGMWNGKPVQPIA